MFTTCTNCRTRFRLTAAQLTAAHGQVRCGQCHQVFDAYEILEGADLPPQMPPEITATEAAETHDVPIQIDEKAAPELDMPMAAEDEPITSAPAMKTGSRRSVVGGRAPPPIDDLFADLLDETESGPAGTPPFIAETDVVEPVAEIESISAEPAPLSFAHVDVLHTPPQPRPSRPWVSAGWWLGIAVLALLLLTQFIDMDRAALSQNAVIGPSLQAVYAALGHPLNKPVSVSDWNVGALNVTTDPDSNGALSITGSLVNQAGFVQPWPELRVVLTDRFGEALRSRDFKPADYLPVGLANALMAPGLAARFRLDIVDPGADAVGFSLTPCLDVPAGRICAVPSVADAE